MLRHNLSPMSLPIIDGRHPIYRPQMRCAIACDVLATCCARMVRAFPRISTRLRLEPRKRFDEREVPVAPSGLGGLFASLRGVGTVGTPDYYLPSYSGSNPENGLDSPAYLDKIVC